MPQPRYDIGALLAKQLPGLAEQPEYLQTVSNGRSDLCVHYLHEIHDRLNHGFLADRRVQHQVIQPTRWPLYLEILLNEFHAFIIDRVHALLGFQLGKGYLRTVQVLSGGGGGIRTPETLSSLTVFKTAGFNRSPTPPIKL